MRHVAILFSVFLLVGLAPTPAALPASGPLGPYDACVDSLTAPEPCKRIDVPAVDRIPKARYYLWAAAYKCPPRFTSACTGSADAQGNSPGILGVLYQDSNILEGLQREKYSIPKLVYPDTMLLV